MVSVERVDISEVQRHLDQYVSRVGHGPRFVVRRYGRDRAAIVSYLDLYRVSDWGAKSGIKELAGRHEDLGIAVLRADLSRFVDGAAGGKRYRITNAKNGNWAGLIGLTDLRFLETLDDREAAEKAKARERDDTFKRALAEAGIEVSWPTEELEEHERLFRLPPLEYEPGEETISDQIVRERR